MNAPNPATSADQAQVHRWLHVAPTVAQTSSSSAWGDVILAAIIVTVIALLVLVLWRLSKPN